MATECRVPHIEAVKQTLADHEAIFAVSAALWSARLKCMSRLWMITNCVAVKKTTRKNSKNLTVLLNVSQIILGTNRSAMTPTCRESKCVCVCVCPCLRICVKSVRPLLRSENSSLNSFAACIYLLVLSMYNVTIT